MLTGSGTSPRERSVLQSLRVKALSDLVFCLALFQYFFTMLLSLYFGKVMYILCHDMLEVCDYFFHFEFLEV